MPGIYFIKRSFCPAMVSLLISLLCGCGHRSSHNFFVVFMVVNETAADVTHITISGNGYPQDIGECSSGATISIMGERSVVGSKVEVAWIDSQNISHKKSFVFSNGVTMSERMHVFLKYSANGDVVMAISRPGPDTPFIFDIIDDSEYADTKS